MVKEVLSAFEEVKNVEFERLSYGAYSRGGAVFIPKKIDEEEWKKTSDERDGV